VQHTRRKLYRPWPSRSSSLCELSADLAAKTAAAAAKVPESPKLDPMVARTKARWLKRVMYESPANSTQKCLAYAIFDHLNCVTLDCWPSQLRLAQLLGFDSVKTVQRAARGLERLGFITVTGGGRQGYRYAPAFTPQDEDNSVKADRRNRSAATDKTVNESILQIHSSRPTPTAAAVDQRIVDAGQAYRRHQRGAIELQLAERLGPGGIDILAKLSSIDDRIVERLCRAHSADLLSDREITAARLAAEQVR